MKSILHIDVNSAFLSWTAVDMLEKGAEEDIRLLPSAIAGDPERRHGIILAKSEIAKKAGIKTAMTLNEAFRRCPDLKLYPPSHSLYGEYSDKLYELLSEYTDVIERFSIDECWLDYTGSEKIFGTPEEAAAKISARIKEELGFTVNIGISTNKLLAKMASEMEKPDKIHTLYPNEIEEKMWPLPVRELFGVGRATEETLTKLGMKTIGDVAKADLSLLQNVLKPAMGKAIHDRANGIDDSTVTKAEEHESKNIGHSDTTSDDVVSEEEALYYLLSQSERVGVRLRKAGKKANVVTVQLKNSAFKTYSHQRKLSKSISTTTEIYSIASELFSEMWRGDALRLLGVSLSDLKDEEGQISLFDEKEADELEKAQDIIREKYGKDAITRGTLKK